jgi:hypothetical protein
MELVDPRRDEALVAMTPLSSRRARTGWKLTGRVTFSTTVGLIGRLMDRIPRVPATAVSCTPIDAKASVGHSERRSLLQTAVDAANGEARTWIIGRDKRMLAARLGRFRRFPSEQRQSLQPGLAI